MISFGIWFNSIALVRGIETMMTLQEDSRIATS
jgi:hypothetical protein